MTALVLAGCADWGALGRDYEEGGVCPAFAVAGDTHTCLRKTSGSLWCWGDNRFGQLGTGDKQQRLTPTRIDVGQQAVTKVYLPPGDGELSTDRAVFTCVIATDGTMWCWGDNRFGQLGLGDTDARAMPTRVEALGATVAKAGNGAGHTCALTIDGSLWCWGRSSNGQLGTDGGTSTTPVKVVGPTFDRIFLGGRHTCGQSNMSELWCWGANEKGQLGLGDRQDRPAPVKLAPLAQGVTRASAGAAHSCLLTSDGLTWCFGDNELGQLGIADGGSRLAPAPLGGSPALHVSQVDTGDAHSCALELDGSLWCWGNNRFGQLGLGDTEPRLVPARVDALGNDVSSAYAGGAHTCAVKTDGSVWCWGNNQYGQLGTGDSSQRLVPTRVMPRCDAM